MKSSEFYNKLMNNAEANLIAKGTEFHVYDNEKNLLGTVAVQRTTIVYLDMNNIPSDLLFGNYIFEEIES